MNYTVTILVWELGDGKGQTRAVWSGTMFALPQHGDIIKMPDGQIYRVQYIRFMAVEMPLDSVSWPIEWDYEIETVHYAQ